ncbi:MAG: metallophosphoesterase [Puniceicoccales bacterium]
MPPPTPDADAALAQRMGEANYARRMEKEIACPRFDPSRQRVSWRYTFKNAVMRILLKCTGLTRRGERNMADIRVESNDLHIAGLPSALDGFRLLQLSDLHFNLAPQLLEKPLKQALSATRCDACVITGDFFEYPPDAAQRDQLLGILHKIEAPTFGCLGNRDPLELIPALETAGVRILLNEAVPIERNGSTIWLVGVDDTSVRGEPDLSHATKTVPADACIILLAHSPDFAETAVHDARINAMLSGHTHGGQLCLPGGIPLTINCPCPRERGSGTWQLGELQGYTSRGTGSGGVPARLNCSPEITLHTLRQR